MATKTPIQELQPYLQENWKEAAFDSLTPVQKEMLPFMLERKDLVVESPTGTGKTLAYCLPLLDKIDSLSTALQAVVIAPTKELVMQIHSVLQEYAKGSNITGTTLIGGVNVQRQVEKLKKKPHYIVGTPGRILELYKNKKVKLHEVKTIVVDEADIVYDMELMDEVQNIVKGTMKDRQLVFVSATISNKAEEIAKEWMNTPHFIKISRDTEERESIANIYLISERRDKIDNLRRIIRHHSNMKAIVFFGANLKLEEIAAKFAYRGITVGVLSGQATKQERQKVMREFRSSNHALLLSTDLAARGLDINGLTHVIHFDLADSEKQFIHRSGRTGRAGQTGTVISLVTEREENVLLKWAKKLNMPAEKAVIKQDQLLPASQIQQKPAKKRNPRKSTPQRSGNFIKKKGK
ncbi:MULTISPECIES: DEAD/DEAH box helicase [Fictibacillus]|uniref:RNA helicase n=1 Tax=Fictibacillus enclensis TaxID=1017270 RepID=A0A0V8JES8_9BACL|nr:MULTISPECIES: DEAD/DEAH box helicase [Fictibacillus]KSU85540.1 RNA helicase [Fictibacillus enclensis]RXY98770.1 ATP-dependent helicase [Fictibacillus sp. S7]SCB98514.1 Superfamily II DNA and RNA helicase [Fictibacillus enclensis]